MQTIQLAKSHTPITIDILKELSALVMKNTGKEYKTALGDFSSAKGELRLLNVTAGIGGKIIHELQQNPYETCRILQ